jgi:hypothetical protein
VDLLRIGYSTLNWIYSIFLMLFLVKLNYFCEIHESQLKEEVYFLAFQLEEAAMVFTIHQLPLMIIVFSWDFNMQPADDYRHYP